MGLLLSILANNKLCGCSLHLATISASRGVLALQGTL